MNWLIVVAVLLVVSSCSSTDSRAPGSFVQRSDIASIVEAAAADLVELAPNRAGNGRQNRRERKEATDDVQFQVAFQSESNDAIEFANAVMEGLKAEIVANGGSAPSGQLEVKEPINFSSSWFRYREGEANRWLTIDLGKTSSDEYPYELTVTIAEDNDRRFPIGHLVLYVPLQLASLILLPRWWKAAAILAVVFTTVSMIHATAYLVVVWIIAGVATWIRSLAVTRQLE